jgi:hypothetical protein
MVLDASLGRSLGKVLGGTDRKSLGKVLGMVLDASVGDSVCGAVVGDVVGDDVTHSPSSVIFSSAVPANMKFPLLNTGGQRLRAHRIRAKERKRVHWLY